MLTPVWCFLYETSTTRDEQLYAICKLAREVSNVRSNSTLVVCSSSNANGLSHYMLAVRLVRLKDLNVLREYPRERDAAIRVHRRYTVESFTSPCNEDENTQTRRKARTLSSQRNWSQREFYTMIREYANAVAFLSTLRGPRYGWWQPSRVRSFS